MKWKKRNGIFSISFLCQRTQCTLIKVNILVLLMPTGINFLDFVSIFPYFFLFFFYLARYQNMGFFLNEAEIEWDRCTDHVNAKGMILLMEGNVLGKKTIWIMGIANVLAVFPCKHTCVCSEITSQETTLPAGQDNYENSI